MVFRSISGLCFVALLVITGCVTMSDKMVMSEFSDTARNYKTAIQWSKFEAANHHCRTDPRESKPPDFERLERIQVAHYNVKQMEVSEDMRQVAQTVAIQYFWRDRMIVKTITDVQKWEYDAEIGEWFNVSGLPKFE